MKNRIQCSCGAEFEYELSGEEFKQAVYANLPDGDRPNMDEFAASLRWFRDTHSDCLPPERPTKDDKETEA